MDSFDGAHANCIEAVPGRANTAGTDTAPMLLKRNQVLIKANIYLGGQK